MTQEFKIGDMVYVASISTREERETCPDCAGTRTMKAILGNGEEHTCECGRCSWGYEGPHGFVAYYKASAGVNYVEITGMEISQKEGIEYKTSSHHCYRTKEVFATKAEAQVLAQRLADEFDAEQNARIRRKERNTKSWAWNVSYHKSCIKKAERDIAYHTEKLNAAKIHKKETAA